MLRPGCANARPVAKPKTSSSRATCRTFKIIFPPEIPWYASRPAGQAFSSTRGPSRGPASARRHAQSRQPGKLSAFTEKSTYMYLIGYTPDDRMRIHKLGQDLHLKGLFCCW